MKIQRAVFPASSTAVYITGVLPIAKLLPGSWVVDMVRATPELSLAVGGVHDIGTVVPKRAMSDIDPGQPLKVGSSLSRRKNTRKLVVKTCIKILFGYSVGSY